MQNLLDTLNQLLIGIVSTASLVTSSVLIQSPQTFSQPTPTFHKEMLTTTGSYSYENYRVYIVLKIPEDGGQVSGNLSGDCTGNNITGNYDFLRKALYATIKARCTYGFFTVEANATVRGTILDTEKTIPVIVTGTAYGLSKTVSTTLNITKE